jgi:hypothetical protein
VKLITRYSVFAMRLNAAKLLFKTQGNVMIKTLLFTLSLCGCAPDVFLGGGDDTQPTDAAVLDAPVDPEGGSNDASGLDGGGGTDALMLMDSPTDTYDAAPSGPRRVFVTSNVYASNFGGVSQGDSICTTVASGAGLGGHWAAWLSSSTSSAASRLEHAAVPYQLLDGTVVASNWAGLVSGTLTNPISRDENDSPVSANAAVWTGTDQTGASETETCEDWTYYASTTTVFGTYGLTGTTNSQWTAANGYWCYANSHLYCIEQP